MSCTERQRLFDVYYESVSAFAAVLTDSDRFWLSQPDERAKSLDAAVEAETARLALEKHEKEHGCTFSSPSRQVRAGAINGPVSVRSA